MAPCAAASDPSHAGCWVIQVYRLWHMAAWAVATCWAMLWSVRWRTEWAGRQHRCGGEGDEAVGRRGEAARGQVAGKDGVMAVVAIGPAPAQGLPCSVLLAPCRSFCAGPWTRALRSSPRVCGRTASKNGPRRPSWGAGTSHGWTWTSWPHWRMGTSTAGTLRG